MRILLTEDDIAVRSLVGRALAVDGHDVDAAGDGVEALDRLEACDGAYDLLVSDVKMPLMDGISLAETTAKRWPKLPIVLITGFADQREGRPDLHAIIRSVLMKPFSLNQFRAVINMAVLPQTV